MARRRHTPEQIIRKLREADRMLAEGSELADVARHLGAFEQTYHRWHNQYGGMKAGDAKCLRELERTMSRSLLKSGGGLRSQVIGQPQFVTPIAGGQPDGSCRQPRRSEPRRRRPGLSISPPRRAPARRG